MKRNHAGRTEVAVTAPCYPALLMRARESAMTTIAFAST